MALSAAAAAAAAYPVGDKEPGLPDWPLLWPN